VSGAFKIVVIREQYFPAPDSAIGTVTGAIEGDTDDFSIEMIFSHAGGDVGMMMAVSFERYGRLYYLDPGAHKPAIGDKVLVPTDSGPEVAECVWAPQWVDEDVGGLPVCAGLAAAHAAGLVHRDVKPQNLLLGTDGVLKLGDFGIAVGYEGTRLTVAGTVLGTAGYLAPEQARGEEVTAAADIYAVGAVLYELLTGEPARTVDSLAELGSDDGFDPPDLAARVPSAPPELVAAVTACLSVRPEDRPASAAAPCTGTFRLVSTCSPRSCATTRLCSRGRPANSSRRRSCPTACRTGYVCMTGLLPSSPG